MTDSVNAFTPVMKVITLNPEEPDPNLQNRVRIRKLKAGARAEITSRSTRTQIIEGQQPNVMVDVGIFRLEQLKSCIVSWEGPLFGDAPCTHGNIENLDIEVFDKIAEEVDSLNSGVTEALKKD